MCGLRNVLDRSRYHHPILPKCIFHLAPHDATTSTATTMTSTGETVIRKDDYLVGPTYARSLLTGQGVDASSMGGLSLSTGATEYEDCDDDDEEYDRWPGPLRCLAALFLLVSCVPMRLFAQHVLRGEETLELM